MLQRTAAASECVIDISELSLSFQTSDGPVQALSGVDLQIARGEFVSFIGPSGCGKTTLLRAVADLEVPTSGHIRVNGMSPHEARVKRAYGYVFQAPALYPWRSVARNIALPLEIMGIGKTERAARVAKGLDLVNLTGFGNKFPFQLSGGMQQRASLARAPRLVRPPVFVAPALRLAGGAVRRARRDRTRHAQSAAAGPLGEDREDRAVRYAFDSRGGFPVDAHCRDVAAPGANPRRHPMRLPARSDVGYPRDARVSGGREPRASRATPGPFL